MTGFAGKVIAITAGGPGIGKETAVPVRRYRR